MYFTTIKNVYGKTNGLRKTAGGKCEVSDLGLSSHRRPRDERSPPDGFTPGGATTPLPAKIHAVG